MTKLNLGKPSLGKNNFSTGSKLSLSGLNPALFGVHINAPTGNIMMLHDAYRGSTFEGGEAGLTGYPFRAEVAYTASVGGAADYQFLLKVYAACDEEHGGVAGTVNGTEVLDGEPNPIPKVYLNGLCRWDFADVRCQLKGYAGATAYTYKLIEKTDGVSALFLFKMSENPDTARTVCVYWGKQTATDESNDAAAEAIIPNAVLSMPMDEGTLGWLAGYPYRKTHQLIAGVGAGTDYQVIVKMYYGAGVDGTEVLNGETVGKVYANSHCKTDFADVRFTSSDGTTKYPYKLTSKTDSSFAIFVVKVSETLDANRTMYTYYGNLTALTESSDTALVDTITGVVLGMPLDEVDAEQAGAIVIVDDDQTAFWGTSGYHCTLSNDATVKDVGINCLCMTITDANAYMAKNLVSSLNLSTKNLIRFYWHGKNTGSAITVHFCTDTAMANTYKYIITDNFIGSKLFSIPFSSFTVTGTPSWANINRITFASSAAIGTIYYLDRLVADVGVPAVDYSGNSNTGTATGTTIEDGRFVGKKARHFGSGEQLAGTTLGYDTSATKSVFFLAKSENIAKDWAAMFTDGMQHFQGSSDGAYAIQFHNGTQNISMGTGNNALANNVWKPVGSTFNRETGKFAVYDNGTLSAEVSCAVGTFADNPNWIVGSTVVASSFIGSLACIIVVTGILTDAQFDNMYNNYPDTRLIAGSVLVRKWATTTLPTHSTWGVEETTTASTTVTDRSGNSNNGVATGTSIVAGKFVGKNARKFNGLSDLLSLPVGTLQFGTSNLTIITAIKSSVLNANMAVVANAIDGTNERIELYQVDTGKIRILAYDNVSGSAKSAISTSNMSTTDFITVAGVRDGTNIRLLINGVQEDTDKAIAAGDSFSGTSPYIGRQSYTAGNYYNGIISYVIAITSALTAANLLSIHNNYPDTRLIAGSIVCRKWATTTLPAVATVSGMETRASFGTQNLYPATDNLNFSIDQATKKATMEFYLENTQEESSSAVEICDDDQAAFWTADATITLTDDTTTLRKGTNSLKMVLASAAQNDGLYHLYGSNQNWAIDFAVFQFYGANTGDTWRLYVSNDTTDDKTTGTSSYYAFTDNFVGWKTFTVPLAALTVSAGVLALATVRKVLLLNTSAAPTDGAVYLDRLIVDTGTWAKVEVAVPDVLAASPNLNLYAYNADTSDYRANPALTDSAYTDHELQFLNETLQSAILAADKGGGVYAQDVNAAVKTVTGDAAAGDLTYSKAKTKYRVGFAIKMPPANGAASATTGIGQVRLKLEVYYV